MLWDQISFCILTATFFALNVLRVIDSFKWCKVILKKIDKKLTIETFNNKDFKFILNSFSSYNSPILFVGFVTETYLYGSSVFGNLISISIAYLVNFLFLHAYIYKMDKNLKTPFEYFERKFNNKYLKISTCICGMFFYLSFLTLYLWGSSTILSTLIPQIPLWASSILIGAYSAFGSLVGKSGFTQSTKINVIQLLVVLIGLIGGVLVTFLDHGSKKSPHELWNIADKFGRNKFIETADGLTTRYTLWNQLFALPIPWCIMHSFFLPNFSKYRSVESENKSRLLLISNLPFMIIVNSLLVISGIACFIYFYECDPVASKVLANKNQISSYWLVQSLSPRIPSLSGLALSCVLSYAVIQHSSGVNLCARTIYNHCVKDLLSLSMKKSLSLNENLSKKLILILTLFLCTLSILYSIAFQYAKNSVLSLFFLFNNSLNSPMLGLILLFILNPFANAFGSILSFVCNLGINIWLGLGALVFSKLKSQEITPNLFGCNLTSQYNSSFVLENFKALNSTDTLVDYYPKNPTLFYLYSISSIWYCLFSICFVFIFGSLFSLLYSCWLNVFFGTNEKQPVYVEDIADSDLVTKF